FAALDAGAGAVIGAMHHGGLYLFGVGAPAGASAAATGGGLTQLPTLAGLTTVEECSALAVRLRGSRSSEDLVLRAALADLLGPASE
ncbi:hypothetical protein LXA31_18005, partial [Erwinia amylovora]|uniref:hypothetical protein n=1 Tax=Erwinia amylovora TaxID=552 RepID=UPI0020BEC506